MCILISGKTSFLCLCVIWHQIKVCQGNRKFWMWHHHRLVSYEGRGSGKTEVGEWDKLANVTALILCYVTSLNRFCLQISRHKTSLTQGRQESQSRHVHPFSPLLKLEFIWGKAHHLRSVHFLPRFHLTVPRKTTWMMTGNICPWAAPQRMVNSSCFLIRAGVAQLKLVCLFCSRTLLVLW